MISKYALIGSEIPAVASVVRATTIGTQVRVLFNRPLSVNASGSTPNAGITTLAGDPTAVAQDGTNQVIMTFPTTINPGDRLFVSFQPNWTSQAIQATTSYIIQ